ncbi:MAG TPA: redoxin family protein [Polyangiaceae bacterium]|nr:redoxin family protein [Polyangiaceae bacterium]
MKRQRASAAFFAAIALLAACSSGAPPARLPLAEPLALPGSDGIRHDLHAEVGRSKLTVFVFYSERCPCLSVHEPRLRELAARYRARGVAFLLVNAEVGAEPAADALEARRRGYPFPLLTDRGATLARALHAEFATHAVVVDARGTVRYSGGLDSDKNRLHTGAHSYLRDALDDLLAGREPRVPDREPLGCALELE